MKPFKHILQTLIGLTATTSLLTGCTTPESAKTVSTETKDFVMPSASGKAFSYPSASIKPFVKLPESTRSLAARDRVLGSLILEARAKGLAVGSPVFIRSFKKEKTMEVWMKRSENGKYKRFKTYTVCSYPGPLGPKTRQGDLMIPEGFYRIDGQALNPQSDYHLALDLGYPNKLERALGRTGGDLMVHGGCESIGCYAVGDANMEEIYTLVYEALKEGQKAVDFHAYPFALTDTNLAKYRNNKWHSYWVNMKQGFDAFAYNQEPPQVLYGQKAYHIIENGSGLAANR